MGIKPLIGAVLATGMAVAGEADLPEAKHRLMLISTRAVANFRAADHIEQRLRDRGLVLHPELTALRLRIEAALDECDAAIKVSDAKAADESIDRAQAFLDRYARRIGGD